MTVPAPGAPDFAGLVPWRSLNLLTLFTETYAAGITHTPVFPTTTYAAVALRFIPGSNGFHITINWWADALGTIGIGNDDFSLSPSHLLLVYLPTEGPYFNLTINNVGGTSDTVGQFAFLTNTSVARPTYPVIGSSAEGSSVTITASSTISDVLPFYAKGRGHLRISTGAAAGLLNVHISQTNDTGGIINDLQRNNGFTGQVEFDYPHPDLRLALFVDNTDASASHTVTYMWWISDDV